MVTVSAPGKVHLIGEHAVVYGKPAILAAVGRRILVTAAKADQVEVSDKEMEFPNQSWTAQECREAAAQAFRAWDTGSREKDFSRVFALSHGNNFKKIGIGHALSRLGIDGGVRLEISGGVPVGSGLGSSASLAVALVKAIAEAYHKPLPLAEVNALAYDIEKVMHGSPSGGDNTACCYGGLSWFVKGQLVEPLHLARPLENVMFVYTRKPVKTTGELVQLVRDLDVRIREPHIEALGRAAFAMRDALLAGDHAKIMSLINAAQEHLARLGVSVPEIDRVHERMQEIGGAAKGCGAMGGGIVLCYHPDKARMTETLRAMGFSPWDAPLAVEGVRVEHS
ncbi:MAG: mevalonate kinase [Candidatus Aenigmarchaeota archaeon]|nr:mevalonate kinase [Candidatus Aenigmarchaeota archaeon]